ncbi:MAG: L-malate glycosyltransferase [Bacteroidales bacterium]|jgi:glycosyltransferase involved in cell wall biosynthesis|nr:L-malate glycosyltransferase [Bacteroidales bacterium]MDN5329163.1 L-malate glycosyltransferase [Bacteroidales bacterium]
MKVMHISTQEKWGGGEQQLLYLIQHLENVLHIVFCPYHAPLHAKAAQLGIKTFPFTTVFSWLQNLTLPYRIWSLVRQNQPDVIHAHDSKAHTLVWLASCLWRIKTPLIVSRRVTLGKHRNYLSRIKYNHPSIVYYICVSEAVRHSLQKVVKQNEKLKVIYSGIHPSRFPYRSPINYIRDEFQIPQHIRIIGNIASLVPAKDYATFLTTASLLIQQRSDLRFFIVGEGPERKKLEELAQQLNINNYVIFTGFRKDIENILPSFDIFLFTSQSEGLGTIVLDAMVCGVPVVATRAGGIPEMIHHPENGLLADPGDAAALAEAVSRLLEDETLRKKITRRASAWVKEFEASRMATLTFKIYKKTVNINP